MNTVKRDLLTVLTLVVIFVGILVGTKIIDRRTGIIDKIGAKLVGSVIK